MRSGRGVTCGKLWKSSRPSADLASWTRATVARMLTAKGISFESQLALKVEPKVRGLALLTSSGSNELSYESRQLSARPLLTSWLPACGSAADQDRDGQVTLAEVYTYLYARTVAASLGGSQGPQHPAQAGVVPGPRGMDPFTLASRCRGSAPARPGVRPVFRARRSGNQSDCRAPPR